GQPSDRYNPAAQGTALGRSMVWFRTRQHLILRELDVSPGVLRQLATSHPERYPVLFDSAADGPLSCTSVLVASPTGALWLDAKGRLHAQGAVPRHVMVPAEGFVCALERWIASLPPQPPALPFCGGWAIFLGYELAGEIEPGLALPAPPASLPWQAFALRVPCALVHDRLSGRVQAIAEEGAAQALEQVERDALQLARAGSGAAATPAPLEVARIIEEEPAAYLERVRRGKEYIRAGDIYQTK